jgi:hypothetical protein
MPSVGGRSCPRSPATKDKMTTEDLQTLKILVAEIRELHATSQNTGYTDEIGHFYYTGNGCNRGPNGTKKRDAGTPMDADYLLRYASACMRNKHLEILDNDARRARQQAVSQ